MTTTPSTPTPPPAAAPPASSTLLPEPATGTAIRFADAHRPTMAAGDYTVSVRQSIDGHDDVGAAALTFRVAGPRLSLPPTAIRSVFPPDGSRGRFGDVLPHVILERSTLPWERSASEALEGATPPWLALVVVPAAEEVIVAGALGGLRDAARQGGRPMSSAADEGEDPTTPVRVLRVPVALLPRPSDLRWQAHVRGTEAATPAGMVLESAVLVAGRHLADGRNRVHLVSLEGLYAGDEEHLGLSGDVTAATHVDLVTLHSWDVTSQADDHHGFVELLRSLDHGLLNRTPPSGAEAAELYYRSGFAPLPHALRTGGSTTSWYHGPLVAIEAPELSMPLPARTADALLGYDATSGMLDVSYAAAWQLGRMLALQNDRVATAIYTWKRTVARSERHAAMRADHPDLPHLHTTAAGPGPFPCTDWLVTALQRMGSVPFRYLVPDAEMLPPESFRFFTVDAQWIRCLIDGALSVGRTSEGDAADDAVLLRELASPGGPLDGMPQSGFLVRSNAVSGYPGLLVDAWTHGGSIGEAASGREPLAPLRIDHLAPTVLLVLLDGRVSGVRLHLHPQTLHFELAATGPGSLVSLADVAHDHAVSAPRGLPEVLMAKTPSYELNRGRETLP